HFVHADRREWPDQRKAGGQRKQQRQHVVAESQPRQDEADQRVDDAEKDDVCAEGGEIFDPLDQGIPDLGDPDAAHRRGRYMQFASAPSGAADRLDGVTGKPELIDAPFNGISDMHCRLLPNRWFEGSRATWLAAPAIRLPVTQAAATRHPRYYS